MDTNMQQTSLDAFYNLPQTKMREDYKRILQAISGLQQANNTMISVWTGIPINIICPRVNELRKLGKLELAKKDFCPYNKTRTMFWRVV